MKPLLSVNKGEIVVVEKIEGKPCFKKRLASVGIFPGNKIKVVKVFPGPMIVEVANGRFALGKGMARRIYVE